MNKHDLNGITLLCGAVIGAGFVGGKEIALFFPSSSVTEYLIFAVVFAICCTVVTARCRQTGAYTMTDILNADTPSFTRWLFAACYLVSLTTMLAAANDCFEMFTGALDLPVWAVVTCFVCVAIMRFGEKGIQKFSNLAVPFIVVFLLVAVTVLPPQTDRVTVTRPDKPLVYALFNFVMCLAVLGSCTRNTKGYTVGIAVTFLVTLLIAFISSRLSALSCTQPLPLLWMISDNGLLSIWGTVSLYLAIITSALANLYPLCQELTALTHDGNFSTMAILCVVAILSVGGYDAIVRYCYPFIALLGLFVLICCGIKLTVKKTVRNKNADCKKHF